MKKYLMTVLIMTTVLFAANEIHYFDIGGQSNLYVRVTRASNLQIYDTVAAELSASPAWANTSIALTQADPNLYAGLYLADMPAVPAGLYYLEAYQGASPAKTDTKLAPWIEYWDGSAFRYISEQIVAVEADVNALNTVVARELVIYDSPTRADATADKAEIVGWLDEANDVDGTLGLIKIQTDKISDVNNNIRSDIADSNLAITARIEDVNLAAADKTGYKLAADGLDALDVNEPANTDPNTWSFRHAALWPFWLGTNIYKMEIPDLNYPGIGTLTLYKRDGVTPFAVQDINETNNVQIRHSIWE